MSSRGPRDGRISARRACRNCNARRVKCNVTEAIPCRNCVLGCVTCELIESRRGKYQRNKKRPTSSAVAQKTIPIAPPAVTSIEGDNIFQYSFDGPNADDDNSLAFCFDILNSQQLDGEVHLQNEHLQSEQSRINARIKDRPSGTQKNASSASPVRHQVFPGEPTSLEHIANKDPDPTLLLPNHRSSQSIHDIDPSLMAEASQAPRPLTEQCPAEIEAPRIDSHAPLAEKDDALVTAYFRWFHPGFPIISQTDFVPRYRSKTVSPLLLQAVLFIGVIHCDEQTLQEIGHSDRHAIKRIFYKACKDIYNSDQESDPITVVQSLFLLSFWRAGPHEMKDTRHWLGSAITLAQSNALHRQTDSRSSCTPALRRRIWWCLCIRERQCASALGLPIRVNDGDSDVDSLWVPQDFVDEMDVTSDIIHPLTMQSALFVQQMCQLSTLLADVARTVYVPDRNRSDPPIQTDGILQRLQQWHKQIPSELQLVPSHEEVSFFSAMLQMSYNNLIILVHRPAFLAANTLDVESQCNAVLQAACRNTRILEDLMANDATTHGQLHLITILFNTLCVHTLMSTRTSGLSKSLAEHRARLCFLGLKEMNRRWEMTNWILELFLKYLDRSIARCLVPDMAQGGLNLDRSSHASTATDDDTTAANSLIALQQASVLNQASHQCHMTAKGVPMRQNMEEIPMGLLQSEFVFGEGYDVPIDSLESGLFSLSHANANAGELYSTFAGV